MRKLRMLVVLLLGMFLCTAPVMAKALYQENFSTTIATTAATFSPTPGTYAVSVQFSPSAVGTVYLERANPTLGITTYQVVMPYTGPVETTRQHGGDATWVYRARAVLTAGTATVILVQGKGDTGSSSTLY